MASTYFFRRTASKHTTSLHRHPCQDNDLFMDAEAGRGRPRGSGVPAPASEGDNRRPNTARKSPPSIAANPHSTTVICANRVSEEPLADSRRGSGSDDTVRGEGWGGSLRRGGGRRPRLWSRSGDGSSPLSRTIRVSPGYTGLTQGTESDHVDTERLGHRSE